MEANAAIEAADRFYEVVMWGSVAYVFLCLGATYLFCKMARDNEDGVQ